jgi:hypothetical protein
MTINNFDVLKHVQKETWIDIIRNNINDIIILYAILDNNDLLEYISSELISGTIFLNALKHDINVFDKLSSSIIEKIDREKWIFILNNFRHCNIPNYSFIKHIHYDESDSELYNIIDDIDLYG